MHLCAVVGATKEKGEIHYSVAYGKLKLFQTIPIGAKRCRKVLVIILVPLVARQTVGQIPKTCKETSNLM